MAQDAKAQGILDKLSTKMKGMKSFYIEFNASVKNSTTGTNENEIGKGWVKIQLACATGKKLHDKRQDLKEKDDKREMDRMLKR